MRLVFVLVLFAAVPSWAGAQEAGDAVSDKAEAAARLEAEADEAREAADAAEAKADEAEAKADDAVADAAADAQADAAEAQADAVEAAADAAEAQADAAEAQADAVEAAADAADAQADSEAEAVAAPASDANDITNWREDAYPLNRWVFWTGVGLTGAAAVTSIVFYALAQSAESDYRDMALEGQTTVINGAELVDLGDKAKDRTRMTNIALGVTATFAVGTALAHTFVDWDNGEIVTALAPTDGGIAVAVGGRF